MVRLGKNKRYWLNRDQPKIPHYSTVTDCFRFDVLSDNNFGKNIDYNLDLSFKLIIRSSKLTKLYHYNTYQTKLYRMVKFLKEQKGLGYRRISHILFTKGYRTVRSKKPIMNNYVYSIYSKGKIRENRIERSFESTLTDLNCTVLYSK